MKISIDLDDTLLKYPSELIAMGLFLQKMGCEVGILSGRAMWDIEQNIVPALLPYGFVPDFVIGASNDGTDPDNTFTEEMKGTTWKPEKTRDHKIDIHFDNAERRISTAPLNGAKVINII